MDRADPPPPQPAENLRNVLPANGNADDLIFPDRVWDRIFNSLYDRRDMQSCRNTCRRFRTILIPFQSTFRFPEIFPRLYKHLSGGEILQLRRVCRAWSDGVDNFFENHKSLRPHDDEDCDPRDPPFLTPMEEKRLHLDVESYMMRDRPPPGYRNLRKPFIGKAIELDLTWSHYRVMSLLFSQGKSILYLTVHLEEVRPCQRQFELGGDYPPFHNFLIVETDNLRKLRIIPSTHEAVFSSAPERPNYPTLPRLEHFETFQYDGLGCARSLTLFHKYHLQLKKVHVDADDWLSMYKLGWPSLRDLHLNRLCRHNTYFKSLLEANMPELRKLGCSNRLFDVGYHDHIGFYNYNGYQLDLILDLIKKLSDSTKLNTFRLEECIPLSIYGAIKSVEEIIALAPSKLRTLELEHYCDSMTMTCYTFLLHFPFIENLHVYWKTFKEFRDELMEYLPVNEALMSQVDCASYPDSDRYRKHLKIIESELVQVNRYLYRGEMYKSNIWEVLPYLKVFTFQLTVYTREEYEKFREQRNSAENL